MNKYQFMILMLYNALIGIELSILIAFEKERCHSGSWLVYWLSRSPAVLEIPGSIPGWGTQNFQMAFISKKKPVNRMWHKARGCLVLKCSMLRQVKDRTLGNWEYLVWTHSLIISSLHLPLAAAHISWSSFWASSIETWETWLNWCWMCFLINFPNFPLLGSPWLLLTILNSHNWS